MLEITKAYGYLCSECFRKEVWFELDGITGYCIRDEGKYYPEIPAYTEIAWNGCAIIYDDYATIKGEKLPSDSQLKELSDAFEPALYNGIKSNNDELC